MSFTTRLLTNSRFFLASLSLLALAALPAGFAFAADTGFIAPVSNTNTGWDNSQNAYAADNARTDGDNNNDIVQYAGFSIPAITGTITGIEVDVEGYTDTPTLRQVARQAQISLSWNGGSSYTSTKTTNLPTGAATTEAIRVFGGATDKWGRTTWTAAELANLRVRLDVVNAVSSGKIHVDQVKVKIFYTAPINTTTTITSDTPDPSDIGQAYTVSLTVAPASGSTRPAGSVAISDGTNSCTDTTASNGTGASSIFSCALTSTTAGTKTLTATYTSTNNFGGSSGTTQHVVNGAAPTPGTAFAKGLVSLSFDDGLKGQTMAAGGAGKILHDNGGFKGTFYIISEGMLGATLYNPEEYNDFMNRSEVMALAADGNEIGVHSRTHSIELASPSADLLFEIDGSRYDLISSTTPPMSTFAYPFGSYSDAVVAQLKKAGIVGARTVDFINGQGQPTFNTPQTDPYKLAAVQLNSNTPITATDAPLEWPVGTPRPEWGYVEKWIDDAVASKTWLILIFHDVQANCGTDTDCITPAKLQTITAYLQSKGTAVSVVPVKDGLAQMNKPATVTDTVKPTITMNNVASGGTITTQTTSASGAAVTFTSVVTDNVDTGLGAFCVNPAVSVEGEPDSAVFFPKIVRSGDTFPVGTTKVNCTAIDQHGNLGLATFNFVVSASIRPPLPGR